MHIYACVYVGYVYMNAGAHGSHRRVSYTLKLELQEAVKTLVWVLEVNSSSLEEQYMLLTAEQSPQTPKWLLWLWLKGENNYAEYYQKEPQDHKGRIDS